MEENNRRCTVGELERQIEEQLEGDTPAHAEYARQVQAIQSLMSLVAPKRTPRRVVISNHSTGA